MHVLLKLNYNIIEMPSCIYNASAGAWGDTCTVHSYNIIYTTYINFSNCVHIIGETMQNVLLFAPTRRLLRLKRRHRDIMDTLVVLIPRLVSVGILLVVVYYFFAIIGIETLHDRVVAGCW